MLICSAGIVLDDQQALAPRLGVFLDARQAPLRAPSVVVGLVTNENAPRASPCWRSSSSVTICTGICRVSGFCLSWLSTRPAQHVGQEHVERDRRRLVLLGELERIGAAHRDQHLEALVAREVGQDARIVRVVLDDQQDRVAGLDVEPVVRESARAAAPAGAASAGIGGRAGAAVAAGASAAPAGPT